MKRPRHNRYRRLGRPALIFLPLHRLEAENAVRAKAFHEKHTVASRERAKIRPAAATALQRIEHFLRRGVLMEAAADWDGACAKARYLSGKHTPATGARTLDLLHVAFALEFESEIFISTDECQAKLAAAEGLNVAILKN